MSDYDNAFIAFALFAAFVVLIVYYIGNQKSLDSYKVGYREGYEDAIRKSREPMTLESDRPTADVANQPQSMFDIGNVISEKLELLDPLTASLLAKEVNDRMKNFVEMNPKTMARLSTEGLNVQVYALFPGMETYEWDVIDRFKLVITSRPIADWEKPIDPDIILEIQDLDVVIEEQEESKDE